MESWLKAKTAGLPRWAWGGIIGGALVIGLYIRARSSEESEPVEPSGPEGLEAYNETEAGAGLAAAGLIGPASSTMVPVQTPFLPEGIVDILTGLGEIITNQGTVIEDITNTKTEYAPGVTGGGAPEAGGDHTPVAAPVAAPKCSSQELARIAWLAGEIGRLTGEAQAIAGAVAAKKAQYPDWQKRDNVRQWINEQEGSKAYKQQKRDEYQNEITRLRQKCS